MTQSIGAGGGGGGGPEVVASGTIDLPASGDSGTRVNLPLDIPTEGHYIATSHPQDGFEGSRGSGAIGLTYRPAGNAETGEEGYHAVIVNFADVPVTVTWSVFEL